MDELSRLQGQASVDQRKMEESPFKRHRTVDNTIAVAAAVGGCYFYEYHPHHRHHHHPLDQYYPHPFPPQPPTHHHHHAQQQHQQQQHQQQSREPEAVQRIINELQRAVTDSQRIDTLRHVLSALQYHSPSRSCHCQPQTVTLFVQGDLVRIVCLQLGDVLHRDSPGREDALHLLVLILDVLYRYSAELTSETEIYKQGPNVLRLLPDVLQQQQQQQQTGNMGETIGDKHNKTMKQSDTTDDLTLPVLSIWHACSSCTLGTTLLLDHPFTLSAITHTLQNKRGNKNCIQECLGLLKNLTYFGEEYRRQILEERHLLTALTGFVDISDCKARERLSAILRNLALSTDVRVLMVRRANILTALVQLVTNSSVMATPSLSRDDASSLRHTLRNVLNTLTSLAMDADSTLPIVLHGDGVLVDILQRFLSDQEDAVVRKRATRTLRLLTRESTSSFLMRDTRLLEMLLFRALNDESSDVQIEATDALARYCGLVRAPMAQHEAVLHALTQLAIKLSTNSAPHQNLLGLSTQFLGSTSRVDILARSLEEQAVVPENCRPLAQREELLVALAKMMLSPEVSLAAKMCACSTLVHLSQVETNLTYLSRPFMLEALVQLLMTTDGQRNQGFDANIRMFGQRRIIAIRDATVRTLLNLSKSPSNWRPMVQQANLLQALIRFASATQADDNLKKEVKSTILILAAEL